MRKISAVVLVAMLMLSWKPMTSIGAGFFYVDNAGNVGIGNTTPEHKLDVSGAMYSRLVTVTDSSSTTVDWNDGNVQSLTLSTSSTTLTFDNGQAGGEYKLIVKQDGTGGRALVWPSGISWPGGTAPTLTTTANGVDMVTFVYDGTKYLGTASTNYKAPPGIVFSDDFNRTNSSTLGNSWSEGTNGSGSDASISSNKLRIQGTSSGTSWGYHAQNTSSGEIVADVIFTPNNWSTNGSYMRFALNAGGAIGDGYGLLANVTSNAISIYDNGTTKASGTFTFTQGTSYNLELDYTSNGHMDVYIWTVGSGKPGSPTISFTNGGSNYTPAASGSNVDLFFSSNNGSSETVDFDDLSIVN